MGANCLCRYIPDGNFKFGAISMSTPAHSDQSILQYRLFVEGEEVWSHTLTSPVKGSSKYDSIWE
jgi:alkaline phosphatase D